MISPQFEALCKELLNYDDTPYWELVWYSGHNQMVLWWNGDIVYIFDN